MLSSSLRHSSSSSYTMPGTKRVWVDVTTTAAKKAKTVKRRNNGQNVHKFKRTVLLTTLTSNDTANGTHVGLAFKLSDLPSYTEFTALFDQYRMKKAVVKAVFSRRNTNTAPAGLHAAGVAVQPIMMDVIDTDDSTALTANTAYEQYETVRIMTSNVITRTINNPQVDLAAYAGGGVFTSYATKSNQWIDCASPSVEHYGYKLGSFGDIEGTAGGYTYGVWNIFVTMEFEFKNVR